ncbi:MAG: ATP-grasp domain-containing protein [Mogibacterium sp.]|nr:ATP-grasp domain-containing protein [Mogibacterium sp.]
MENITELKKHKFIVIGVDHYTPLGLVRSLGINGIRPYLIVLRKKRFSAGLATASRYVKKVLQIDSFEELPDLLLSQFGDEEYKPFVYTCNDVATSVLDDLFDELQSRFILSNCGGAGMINHYMQKEMLNDAARKAGLNVATTWTIENDEIPDNVIYPVITKPFESYEGWKKDYYVCSNREELADALKKVSGKVFIQQYIKKETELCLDGCVINHGTENFVSAGSIYTYILPDYYSMEMVVTEFKDRELNDKVDNLFKALKYEGIYSFEFLIDESGNKWFLEVNFRNSTWSWASTSVGMNLPLLWAYGMLFGEIPEDAHKTIPDNYIALAEIADYEQRVVKRKMMTTKEWFKGVKRADCLFFFDRRDLRPFISISSRIFVREVIKKLKRG